MVPRINSRRWFLLERMRCRGDMPPPVPKRVANPRNREDQALQEFHSNSDNMHRPTPEDEFAQTWFDYGRSLFPDSVRKTCTHVELYNLSTYRCSILFNNTCSFNRKSEVRKPQNLNKPNAKGEKFNVADLSLLREFWRNNNAHVFLTAEAGSLSTDATQLLEDYGFGGMPLKQK